MESLEVNIVENNGKMHGNFDNFEYVDKDFDSSIAVSGHEVEICVLHTEFNGMKESSQFQIGVGTKKRLKKGKRFIVSLVKVRRNKVVHIQWRFLIGRCWLMIQLVKILWLRYLRY